MLHRPMVAAFDIIGTVFSLEPLRPRLMELGLPSTALELWFASGLRDAFALAASEAFQPLKSVFESALDEVLQKHRIAATDEQKRMALSGMAELPPHADAKQAFEALKSGGIRIIGVSNGAAARTRALLDRAELLSFVEKVISVDDVQVSKPRKQVYLHAAQSCGAEKEELALIATHAWDIQGARPPD
jgi:2-haloacid dehalogenase